MIFSRHPQPAQSAQRTFAIVPFDRHDPLRPIVAAWARAFTEPPNGPRSSADLEAQLQRHLRCPGFAGFVARDATQGDILGIVYGYSNVAGEWWRDRVAQAMSLAQIHQVLDQSYCLSELGVIPEARRLGIAEALVNALEAAQPHPYLLLSTRSDNRHGLAFYGATGWHVLLPAMSFGWNYAPYDILMRVARSQDEWS